MQTARSTSILRSLLFKVFGGFGVLKNLQFPSQQKKKVKKKIIFEFSCASNTI
jgi:hypothetical protein